MINVEDIEKIMNGILVSIEAEDKDEIKMRELIQYFASIIVRVNCTTIAMYKGGYKIIILVPPMIPYSRSLIVNGLVQSRLNFKPSPII